MNARLRMGWRALGLVAMVGALQACGSTERVPDWALIARDGSEAGGLAHLEGRGRLAQAQWQRAADATARTADPLAMARVALAQCAVRLASLETNVSACVQAEAWLAAAPGVLGTQRRGSEQPDAAAELGAYAGYIQGRWPANQPVSLLPSTHRPIAALMAGPASGSQADAEAAQRLLSVADPLSRLVAASALWRSGRVGPAVMAVAVDTASAQAWARPLLAWLELHARWAESAGEIELARGLRQRMAWVRPAEVTSTPAKAPEPKAD